MLDSRYVIKMAAEEIEWRLMKVPGGEGTLHDAVATQIIEQEYNPESEKTLSGKAIASGIAEATRAVKEELLNGAGEAYDTLKELGELIEGNNVDILEILGQISENKADKETLEALTQEVAKKADETHNHDDKYLTVHQDITHLATKTYVDDTLVNYAKKSELPTALSAFTNDLGYITDVSDKADLEHTHTLSEIIDYVAPEIPSIEGLASKEYVDETVKKLNISELTNDTGYLTESALDDYAKKTDYYTKEEVDNLLAGISAQITQILEILNKESDV